MKYDIFDSPVGKLIISTDGNYITSLHIGEDKYFTAIPDSWIYDPSDPLLKKAKIELREYFSGERKYFDLPIAIQGTPFQQKVWNTLRDISAGSTSTYAKIAQEIGNSKATRAVGTAIGHNPICIIIPCHRVIKSDGSLGCFAAGQECKQKLLNIEGITITK